MNFDIDIAIVLTYLLTTLIIGIWKGRGISTLSEYAVANRNYPTTILVATIFATWIGGGSTFGVFEKIYIYGFPIVFIFFGNTIKKLLIARFFSQISKKFKNSISFGDILEHSYGREGKIITGLAASVISIGEVSAQIAAISYLLSSLFNFPIVLGIVLSTSIVVIYSAFGGIKAVAITDVIQFGVIIVAIPMILSITLDKLGGYANLANTVPQQYFTIEPSTALLVNYLPLFVYLCFPFETPAVAQRILMARNAKQIRQSMYLSALFEVPLLLVIGLIGITIIGLYPNIDSKEAIPILMNEVLPIGIKGIVISGFLAVIMSSADSFLNTASIAFVNDLLIPLKKDTISSKNQLLASRIFTIFLGVVSIFVVMKYKSIIDIFASFFGIWGATVLIPLIAAMLSISIRKKHFLITVAISLVVFICSYQTEASSFAILIGIATNAVLFFSFYFLAKPPVHAVTTVGNDLTGSHIASIESGSPKKKKSNKLGKRQNTLSHSLNRISFKVILDYCTNRVESHGAQYIPFGIFAVINYVVPFFMWQESAFSNNYLAIALRFVAGILCFMLIIKDYWPRILRKYLPIYWHLTLLYCLPFYTTYLFLENPISTFWLVNICLALFLLITLVDWLTFIILISLGTTLGYSFFIFVHDIKEVYLDDSAMYITSYMFIFAILIGGLFSRNKEFLHNQLLKIKDKLNRQLELKVSERTEDLTKALAAKKEFLNNMSHEIRIPLQGILSISREVVDQWEVLSDKEKFKYSTTVADSGDRLMALVSNLLDLSKIEAGKMQFIFNENDFRKTIKEVAGEFNILGKKSVKINVPAQLNTLIEYDQQRISQVIRNLISNALKYGKGDDGGLINIRLTRANLSGGEALQFSITDSGVGIPSSQLDLIFKPFEQSSNTKTGAGGSGLGLAICKDIIEAHRGKIWAENNKSTSSESLPGATFFFVIPCLHRKSANTLEKTSANKKNILLIDDEETALTAGSLVLAGLGHNTVKASGGIPALEYLEKTEDKIDAILLDLMMPDMYGINVLEQLKQNNRLKDIPVILQTGSNDQAEINKAYELGVVGHVSKPYMKPDLKQILDNILS